MIFLSFNCQISFMKQHILLLKILVILKTIYRIIQKRHYQLIFMRLLWRISIIQECFCCDLDPLWNFLCFTSDIIPIETSQTVLLSWIKSHLLHTWRQSNIFGFHWVLECRLTRVRIFYVYHFSIFFSIVENIQLLNKMILCYFYW